MMRRPAAAVLLLAASPAAAEVGISPKHLLIVRPGIDAVWGSYVFAVQNDGEAEAPFKARIMLPRETVDFMRQFLVDAVRGSSGGGGGGAIDVPSPGEAARGALSQHLSSAR